MPLVFPPDLDPQNIIDPLGQQTVCAACHLSGTGCIQDVRATPIKGRRTTFQIGQDRIIGCAFEDYVPGCVGDPDPDRPSMFYRRKAIANMMAAAKMNFPATGSLAAFLENDVSKAALGKVDGDMFEVLEAAALWNAAAAWNEFMDTGVWPVCTFTPPTDAIPTPLLETFDGADVAGAYQAASLYSLVMGGGFSKAVDHLFKAVGPRATGQEILKSLPSYAL